MRSKATKIFDERKNEIATFSSLSEDERRIKTRRLSTIYLEILAQYAGPIDQIIANARILKLAMTYLGNQPRPHENSFVRELVPGPEIQSLPFHQDQTILQAPLLNIWAPLDPCGITAPGLELVLTRDCRLREVSGSSADLIPVERVRLDEHSVVKDFGTRALWHPVLEPGDALVFAGTTIHRSYVTPEMTVARMSIELRLV
jgi:hypothetical protein